MKMDIMDIIKENKWYITIAVLIAVIVIVIVVPSVLCGHYKKCSHQRSNNDDSEEEMPTTTTTTTTTTISPPTTADCYSNTDCAISNTECNSANVCVCRRGYSYSNGACRYIVVVTTPRPESGGCFTKTSTVLVEDIGVLPMDQLRVGHRVQAMTTLRSPVYSEVIDFLHRGVDIRAHFINLETDSKHSITLTDKHLLYIIKQNITEFVYADSVRVGDLLMVVYNDSLITSPIKQITNVTGMGVYAPLTMDGTIVVNNVVASCYAHTRNPTLAHKAFAPLRLIHIVKKMLFTETSLKQENSSTNVPEGVQWYAKMLSTVFGQ